MNILPSLFPFNEYYLLRRNLSENVKNIYEGAPKMRAAIFTEEPQ